MKTPVWEASPNATVILLATRQFVFCDLYTFTLATSAGVLRYANGDAEISYGGNTWVHGGPIIDADVSAGSRPTAHWKVGLDADTWQTVIFPRAAHPVTGVAYPDKIAGIPWLQAARAGLLDGAVVSVNRAYFASWPLYPLAGPIVPTGVVNVFTGRVASLDIGRTSCAVTLNSHIELLGVQMPRNLYQPSCAHTLFDAGCTLVAASFAKNGTVAGLVAGAANQFTATIATPAGSGYYTLGRVNFTSGNNAGFWRGVRDWFAGSPSGFVLIAPPPFPLAIGDTFTAYPGCLKDTGTCTAFANLSNFGGEPFIPVPETAV